jgi:hypothetical protein
MAMPYFDKTSAEDFGKLKLVGTDDYGNEIYSLGTQDNNLGNLLEDLASIQGLSDQYVFISTSPYINMILRIGGWLSRSASLPFLGRPLVIKGLRQSYPQLCSLLGSPMAGGTVS